MARTRCVIAAILRSFLRSAFSLSFSFSFSLSTLLSSNSSSPSPKLSPGPQYIPLLPIVDHTTMPALDDPGPAGPGSGAGGNSNPASTPSPAAPVPTPIANGSHRRDDDWTDGATDQAIAIAIAARDKENPPGEGDSISGSLIQMDGGELLTASTIE